MYKLKNKGFTMIETLCSITLFMTMTTISLNILNKSVKLKLYNENLENSINFTDALRKNIIYNMSSHEINKISCKKLIISNEKLHIQNLKDKNFLLNFNIVQPKAYPYLTLNINDKSNKYKFYITIYLSKSKIINGEFEKEK